MNRFLTLFICLFLAVSSSAQLLWRISGRDLEKPSYLFGTYHLASLSVLDSIEGVMPAIRSVDKVYGEVVASDMLDSDTLVSVAQRLILPGDTELADLLAPQEFSIVEAFLNENLGLILADINMAKMFPVALTNQITVFAAAKGIPGYNPSNPLDAGIQALAKQLGKDVGGLESVSFQMDLMVSQPLKRQAEQLVCTVESFDSLVVQSKRLTDAYYSQDLLLIEALMIGDGVDSACDYTQEEKDAIINERNKAWLRKMPGIMESGSTLFAVGAGHLAGSDGLIALLVDAGYDVEPVEKLTNERMQ